MRAHRLRVAHATVVFAGVAGCGAGAPGILVMGDDVPDDLRALASDVFDDFEASFAARIDCMDDVRLIAVWEGLDDRARYLPDTRVIEVRVPATANLLSDSLVHELAHHLDHTCDDIQRLRPAFLDAQGHPAGAAWSSGTTWEETPAEQFAETAILVVLGDREQNRLRMPIRDEAVALVARWGAGSE
jgi:hypothetical protein